MNYLQRISWSVVILASSSFLATAAETKDDFFDNIIAWADSPDIAQIIETEPVTAAVRTTTKEDILALLNDLGVISLLQENFFLRSNNIIDRPLPDYPEFINHLFRHERDKEAIYIDLFYNQTNRSFFTKESSNINTYLAISDPTLRQKLTFTLNEVSKLAPQLKPLLPTIQAFTDLASTFTVQERRLGLMIGGKHAVNRFHINVMAPLYYLERNHFVDAEVEADLRELSETLFGPPNPKQEKEFQDNHLISDKFGIGDTRIYADYPIFKNRFLHMRLGALATIPTAFAFQKGLRGSHYKRITTPPTLDLFTTIDAAQQNNITQAQDLVLPFGFAALDNLAAMLLDSPLGNGGHVGLGLYMKNRTYMTKFFDYNWARQLIYRTFMSLEYILPATELRSYIIPANLQEFNARNFGADPTPEEVDSNFDFVVQQLSERLFPVAMYTKVYPGLIFHSTSQLCYEGDTKGFTFGTDTYVRTKERLKNIAFLPGQNFLIEENQARAPLVYQSKAVASCFWKLHQPDKLWTLSLMGDYTFMNKGIGTDFMLTFMVDVNF